MGQRDRHVAALGGQSLIRAGILVRSEKFRNEE